MTIRILVTGGRNYADADYLSARLGKIHQDRGIAVIIHGAASGADSLADAWARRMGIPVETYPADWAKHGRAAGPLRNWDMLARSKPDGAVAFPGGRGTQNMVTQALTAGVKVWDLRGSVA